MVLGAIGPGYETPWGTTADLGIRAEADPARGRRVAVARLSDAGSPWWVFDQTYLGQARWKDARVCIEGNEVRFREDVPCGTGKVFSSSSLCNWGFYNLEYECNLERFSTLLFQIERYQWCQGRLAYLLTSEPGRRTPENASSWVDWCRNVMRVVSMARWSTNISSTYQRNWRYTTEAIERIVYAEGTGPPAPTRFHPRDIYPKRDLSVISLYAPRDLNDVGYEATQRYGPLPIPRTMWDFDAVIQEYVPSRWFPRSPGGELGQQMTAWFVMTLGTGFWWKNNNARISYLTREGCGFSLEADNICRKVARGPAWYGGADATIELCRAWAQDVIETSFGTIVAQGLGEWLDQYDALPAGFKILSNESIGMIRTSMTAEVLDAALEELAGVTAILVVVGGAIAASAATSNPVGYIAAIFLAVIGLIIAVIQLAGAAAFGGGVIESACLKSPVVRSIQAGADGACNFDTRQEAVIEAQRRLNAIWGMALAGAPIADWFEASRRAGSDSIIDLFDPPPPPPGDDDDEGGLPAWAPWALGAVGATLLVVLAKKG